MLIRLPIASVVVVASAVAAGAATEFNWPGRGVLSFDVPPNWTLQGKPVRESGFYFVARTQSRNQAVMQITLMEMLPDKPVKEAGLLELLNSATAVFLPTSVEKKVVPRGMLLAQGTGFWTEFTDARLVGRPSVPGDFKFTRSAMIGLDEHTVAGATMQFDVKNASEPAAMLAILSSMRLKRGNTSGPATSTLKSVPPEFTVPGSRVSVVLGVEGLDRRSFQREIRSNDSGYFLILRPEPNLNLSGWVEPASAYRGVKKLWEQDSAKMAGGGLGPFRNVSFGKHGKWEIVSYDHPLGDATNCHVRAHIVQSGTWIDVHLSSVSEKPRAEALAELLEALNSIQVLSK